MKLRRDFVFYSFIVLTVSSLGFFAHLVFSNEGGSQDDREVSRSKEGYKGANLERPIRISRIGDAPVTGSKELLKGEKKVMRHERVVSLEEVPTLVFSPQESRDQLIRRTSGQRKDDGGYRFAEAITVNLSPNEKGLWDQTEEGALRWRLKIQAPEALSLNFGYSQYQMPEGGSLVLSTPGEESPYRPFTNEDNEAHGQLWTPILDGDEVLMTVVLNDPAQAGNLKLKLASVNYGFRSWQEKSPKIGGDTSGSCNIDVNCTASDIGNAMIDLYQDQIRAVGAYTLNGIDTCSGTLVNNTALDNAPYFLTADHCGITTANAPSMVLYWNFQNSTCRAPGSAQSGTVGNGDLTQFNSGAIFRSESASSDFTLVELDDAIDAASNVYLAGWDRSGAQASSTVGIHHPAVAEKRISFDFDPTSVTSYYGNVSPGGGTHFRVTDWDLGTTEGGSSGSGLFDQNGRVIGQLHGGDAACGNDDADWYGRLFTSWTGGGSSGTRLSDWLDPLNTGATFIDGKDYNGIMIAINDVTLTEGDSGSQSATFTVTLAEAGAAPIAVSYSTQNGTATAGSDFVATSGTLNFSPGVTSLPITVAINGDTTPEENESFALVLSGNSLGTNLPSSPGIATILNDDFVPPVITSTLSASGTLGASYSYQVTADNTPTTYALANAPLGMSINPMTGLATWVPHTVGVFSVDLIVANGAGSDQETLTLSIADDPFQRAAELDQWPSAPISQAGNASWFNQAATTQDGVDAAQAGNVDDVETSSFSVNVFGPGTVSFWWQVDSEADYDFLNFLVDGAVVQAISGNTNWVQITQSFGEGAHTLTWSYVKDFSVSDGGDTGFVDGITLGGYAGWIASHRVGSQTGYADNGDGDCYPNLLEYGYALNPEQADQVAIPTISQTTGGSQRFTFPKNPTAVGLSYGGQFSQNLQSWSAANANVVSDTATEMIIEANFPNPQPEKLFFKAEVTITP